MGGSSQAATLISAGRLFVCGADEMVFARRTVGMAQFSMP